MHSIGFPLISIDFQRFPLISIDFHWFPLISMDFHGFPWISMVSHGFPWVSYGFPLISIDFHGFPMIAIVIAVIVVVPVNQWTQDSLEHNKNGRRPVFGERCTILNHLWSPFHKGCHRLYQIMLFWAMSCNDHPTLGKGHQKLRFVLSKKPKSARCNALVNWHGSQAKWPNPVFDTRQWREWAHHDTAQTCQSVETKPQNIKIILKSWGMHVNNGQQWRFWCMSWPRQDAIPNRPFYPRSKNRNSSENPLGFHRTFGSKIDKSQCWFVGS